MEDISLMTFAGEIMDEETNSCNSEDDLLKNLSLEDFLEEDLEDMEEETNREELTSAYDLEETSCEDHLPEKEYRDDDEIELAEENSEKAIHKNATAVQADLPGNV